MEEWKQLKNFPGYEGSTEGRIRNIRTQKIQKPTPSEKGYLKVSLHKNKKRYSVKAGRAIAETFLEGRSDMDVRYKDNDRTNISVDNLEWCTRSDLIKDAYLRGTKKPRNSQ